MSSSNGKKLVGAATGAFAIGLLLTPAPAQALPDCYSEAAECQFAGGEVIIHYPETDAETKFNAPRGITVDAPAETFYGSGTSLKGRVSGKIDKGGNWINLTVTRGSKYPPLFLNGAVDPDNTASGTSPTRITTCRRGIPPLSLCAFPARRLRTDRYPNLHLHLHQSP